MKIKTPNGEIKPIRKYAYKEAFIILSDYRDFGQTYAIDWTDSEIIEDITTDFFKYYTEEGDVIREISIKKVIRYEFMED